MRYRDLGDIIAEVAGDWISSQGNTDVQALTQNVLYQIEKEYES